MDSCQNCPVLKQSIFYNQKKEYSGNYPHLKKQLSFKKGETIFGQNTSPTGIYCIKQGDIKVIKSDIHGNDTIVKIADAGDIIGDDIILSQNEFKKSATAMTDAVVCYIDKNSFSHLLSNKSIGLNLLKKTLYALRKAEEHICSCHQKKVIARLSELLIDLKKKNGIRENNQWKVDLNLSREELAMLVGTAPETLIRSFAELKKMGIISGQKIVYINNEEALENMANNNSYERNNLVGLM
jgi:CRP/FNR family transcriptional regulator